MASERQQEIETNMYWIVSMCEIPHLSYDRCCLYQEAADLSG